MMEYYVCLSITRREKHRREGWERHVPVDFIEVGFHSEEEAKAVFTHVRQTVVESHTQERI